MVNIPKKARTSSKLALTYERYNYSIFICLIFEKKQNNI